jgi:hypothetical protein
MEVNLMTKELAPLTALERIANPLEAITALSSIDELDEAVSHANGVIAGIKDMLEKCKAEYEMQLLQIIEERGAFQLGSVKYYKGVNKSNKQAPPLEILNALSDATGGDFEKIVGCLSSSAFKAGASKKILGKDSELFWSVNSDTVKTSVLKKIDTRFLNEGEK